MGYTTDFYGDFVIDPPLSIEHREYLKAFAETRRMKRDAKKAEALPDPLREAVGLPIGIDGAYFVNGSGFMGQSDDPSVIDSNAAPGDASVEDYRNEDRQIDWTAFYDKQRERHASGEAQPGLWCQWRPNADGTALEWDEGEKFYEYIPWLHYLIEHFFRPWGYTLTGEVTWQGEETEDQGKIIVTENTIEIQDGEIIFTNKRPYP